MLQGIVRNGLILNLDAGDKASYPGSGTTIYDTSGSNNNAEITAPVLFNSANGGGLIFTGSQNLQLNSLISGLSSFTVELILNFSLYSYQAIGFNFCTLKWRIAEDTTYFNFFDSQNNANTIWYSFVPPTNNCLIFHASFDGTKQKLYFNGVHKTTITKIFSPSNQVDTQLFASEEKFVGKLFAVRVYNRALTEAEVLQNYNTYRYKINEQLGQELMTGGNFENGLIGSKVDGNDGASTWLLNTTLPCSGRNDGRLIINTIGSQINRPYLSFGTSSLLLSGKVYKVEFDYKVNSGTPVLYQYYNGQYALVINKSFTGFGKYTFYVVCLSSTYFRTYWDGRNIFDIQMDNLSIKEVI